MRKYIVAAFITAASSSTIAVTFDFWGAISGAPKGIISKGFTLIARFQIDKEDVGKEVMIINDSNEDHHFRPGIKEIHIISAAQFTDFKLRGIKIESIKIEKSKDGYVSKRHMFSQEGVYYIYYVFENCITDMSYMFSECSHLRNVYLPYLDTSKVDTMAYMFNKCVNITALDLENCNYFDTSCVKDMSYLCNKCEKLKNININKCNTTCVRDMSHMFYGCESLESDIPSQNIDCRNVENMCFMFGKCRKWESVKVKFKNTEKLQDISHMFGGCDAIEEIVFEDFNTVKVSNMRGLFAGCINLRLIKFNDEFHTGNVEDMSYMFAKCCSLSEVNLEEFNTKNVKKMSYMFSKCGKLSKLNLCSFDTRSVESTAYMFSECTSLASIAISENFTLENAEYSVRMFNGCKSIKCQNFEYLNTQKMKNMKGFFSNCSSLKFVNMSFTFAACCGNYKREELYDGCPNFKISITGSCDSDYFGKQFCKKKQNNI